MASTSMAHARKPTYLSHAAASETERPPRNTMGGGGGEAKGEGEEGDGRVGGLIGVATLPAAFLRQQQTPICDGGKEVRQQTATSRKGGTKSAPPIPCPRPTPCSF